MRRWWIGVAALVVLGLVITRNTIRASRPAEPVEGPGGQVVAAHGPVDPEVEKGLKAFGLERYDEARGIAEHLLGERNRGTTHAEAVDLLVESWLAEGEYARARTDLLRHQKQAPFEVQEALQRIESEERHYQEQLQRYQTDLARAKQPEQAAEAQLGIGRLHQQTGRRALAEAAYREVVAKYPGTVSAKRAKRHLKSLTGEAPPSPDTTKG